MAICEAFIIGGSAGSLQVLLEFLPRISKLITFPLIIVLHRKPGKDNLLTNLLAARTALTVKEVEEKELIEPGTVYIAPSDYHLLIENNRTFSLDASEKVNFSRPAVDVTFESAANVFRENLVCLLLSGANADGTAGLMRVKKKGGTVALQDPATAVAPFMPENAAQNITADAILRPDLMADYINSLIK